MVFIMDGFSLFFIFQGLLLGYQHILHKAHPFITFRLKLQYGI